MLFVMILSTMVAVLGLNDDGREEASKLSGLAKGCCLNDGGGESKIGAREF